MNIKNTYLSLGEQFFEAVDPEPVAKPRMLVWNAKLANELELPDSFTQDKAMCTRILSGNAVFEQSQPIALAYAGHQFGQYSPCLGDGRAHLLGEWFVENRGTRVDLQLKGSGKTRFSRGGDGRCALGPALREYIMSEALAGLGVPTARTLSVVSTGEKVLRQREEPGGIVARVASSHLRVGSFEYFYAQGDMNAVERLADFAIARHYPDLSKLARGERYMEFLRQVCNRQIALVCEWMRVGFIHGVMNTDNTTISGETIDFGPCAMMNAYNPDTVFSSIDKQGRYRFGFQPVISQWNMARLAEALLPLFDKSTKRAIAKAEAVISEYTPLFSQAFNRMMARKIGLEQEEELVGSLLDVMRTKKLDYTNTFVSLTQYLKSHVEGQVAVSGMPGELDQWVQQWLPKLANKERAIQVMQSVNPLLIPRNHIVESVIQQAAYEENMQPMESFVQALRSPYTLQPDTPDYQAPPADGDRGYRTFCGT